MLVVKPYMQVAKVWAEQSKCVKRKVGACIFNERTGQILSTGYNGTVAGFKVNCCDLFSVDNDRYFINTGLKEYLPYVHTALTGWVQVEDDVFRRLHKQFSSIYETHAEQNAIYNLLKSGTVIQDFSDIAIAVTLEPCEQCAKALVSLGIKHIIYLEPHNSSRLIEHVGVRYEQYIES